MKKRGSRDKRLLALKKESDQAVRDQIRRLLVLPINQRTHFLQVRRPGGGSHL